MVNSDAWWTNHKVEVIFYNFHYSKRPGRHLSPRLLESRSRHNTQTIVNTPDACAMFSHHCLLFLSFNLLYLNVVFVFVLFFILFMFFNLSLALALSLWTTSSRTNSSASVFTIFMSSWPSRWSYTHSKIMENFANIHVGFEKDSYWIAACKDSTHL